MKWPELVKPIPLSFHQGKSLETAIEEMVNHKVPAAPVVNGGKLVGMLLLQDVYWPGNVRELENCIERLLVLSDSEVVSGELIKAQLFLDQEGKNAPIAVNSLLPLREAQEIVERELIQRALQEYRTVRGAAKALGIAHSNIVRNSERYGLRRSNSKR